VQKLDDTHVRFEFGAAFPEALVLQALVHFQVVPQKYLEQVGEAGFTAKPVGSGPFRYARGTVDSQIVLERSDAYWAGPSKLKQAVFRMMPEPSTRVAALLAGEVQIIQEVAPDLVSRLQTSPGIQVKTAEGTRSYEIELNNKAAPFNDPRVRQALNYAIDWNAILKEIYRGYAKRLATAFLPSGFGYDSALRPYPYDPAKARELLKAAGY
jgi:peptide/nickel transport system substrate-binding protein